ncbi:hypothetical protein [Streptomyces sp. NPDC002403]
MAAAAVGAVLVAGPVADASAAQRHWNKKTRCEQTDPEGRVIPTRYGNGDLGWNHFSGKHNIRKCRIVDAALAGKVNKKGGGRLEGKKIGVITAYCKGVNKCPAWINE